MAYSNRKNFYGSFAKIDHEERTVSGYASTEAEDDAGEKILKSGISEALDDYMKFANIREMHKDSAVGVAEDAFVDEKGLYLVAKVVDESAWAKVVAGVYKGFSVGGKVLKRSATDRSIIEKLRLCEISLVDRPCNPEAVFDVYKTADANDGNDMELDYQMWVDGLPEIVKSAQAEGQDVTELALAADYFTKRTFDAAQRKADAKSGHAMPDGSFPIDNESDLENAIHLAGKAKDPAAARAHIKRRAAAMGLSDKIPDTWKSADAEEVEVVEKTVDVDVAPAAVLADTTKKPAKEGAEGAPTDGDKEDHTADMDPVKDPAVKVESAENAADPLVKAEAMFAAIEALDKPAVEETVIEKSAEEIEAELRAEIESLKKVLAEKDAAFAVVTEQVETLTKAASLKDEELTAGNDKLAKFAERAVANFEKLTKRIDDEAADKEAMNKRLTQEIEDLKKFQVLPAKTLGPGAGIAGAVEKSADASGSINGNVDGPKVSDEDIKKALASMSEKDRALVLIKAAHQFPRQIAVR